MIEAAVLCMALNLYHEGDKNEPIEGLFAIAQVVLNRAGRDPEKVCEVVYAPHQFSWTQRPARLSTTCAMANSPSIGSFLSPS